MTLVDEISISINNIITFIEFKMLQFKHQRLLVLSPLNPLVNWPYSKEVISNESFIQSLQHTAINTSRTRIQQ